MESIQDIANEASPESREPDSKAVASAASVDTGEGGTVAEGAWITPLAAPAPSPSEEYARDSLEPEIDRSSEAPAVSTTRRARKQRSFHRACKSCTSPAVSEIEALCSQGVAATIVGKRFKVSSDSVRRHWREHVDGERKARLIGHHVFAEPVEVADQFEVLKSSERSRWLARLSIQRSDLTALTKHSDPRVAVMAHRTLLTLAEITGKHLDLLNVGPSSVTTTNVLNLGDVDVMALKQILQRALLPFAGAWGAVQRALSAPTALPAPGSEQ